MYCVEWVFFIFTTYFSSSKFLQINFLFYVTGGILFFDWALFGFPLILFQKYVNELWGFFGHLEQGC